MTEEPYRWLEAIENRREYARTQIGGGAPVIGLSLTEGVLLVGVGAGRSKVFEIFDRQAMAGLGHPADLEKVRQAAIDSAHLEAFTRAPEDVGLRRLVGYGLGPQIKANFEQIYSAPFLVELLFAEVGRRREEDVLMRLHFDGTFEAVRGGVAVAADRPEPEQEAQRWLAAELGAESARARAVDWALQAWWAMGQPKRFEELAPEEQRREGWRKQLESRTVEIGWLERRAGGSCYRALTLEEAGL